MPEEQIYAESRKLIRCFVTKKGGEPSIRFVELEFFKLWKYMMQNRHGFEVDYLSLCLWVNRDRFDQNRKIYEASGRIEDVDRIQVAIFDKHNGFCHTTNRYVPTADTSKFQGILLSHVADDVKASDGFEISAERGVSIEKETVQELKDIVLGLADT